VQKKDLHQILLIPKTSQIEICFVEEKISTIEIQLCCGHFFGVMQEISANANCTQKIANLHSERSDNTMKTIRITCVQSAKPYPPFLLQE
jgi:hypothetical protein